MKTIAASIIAITLASMSLPSLANRTECKQDFFDPRKLVCESSGGTRTTCKPDFFDPRKMVCETN
jgi:hypothetical protein